jgi:hypothetical protein
MTIPLYASGLNFWAGPGLGRAARAFYSVKQLKTAFRVGLGQKNFAGFKISARAHPERFVGGPGAGRARSGPAGRAGLKMLWYTYNSQQIASLEAHHPAGGNHYLLENSYKPQ